MREILFRGKRVDNGEWAESPYPYGTMSGGVVQHDFISQTVGQYTGLTDKNGVKIFEGDIIRHYNDLYDKNIFDIGVICWDNDKSRFYRTSQSDEIYTISFSCDYEVIGNIHDNPS